MENERVPFELPVLKKKDRKNNALYVQKICSVIKNQVLKVVNGDNTTFDQDISKVVERIWQDGYGKGLKDMDFMHEKASKL